MRPVPITPTRIRRAVIVPGLPATDAALHAPAARRSPREPVTEKASTLSRTAEGGYNRPVVALVQPPAGRSHGRLRGVLQRGVPAVQPGEDRSSGPWVPGRRLRLRRRPDLQRQELPDARARRPSLPLAQVRPHRPGPDARRARADQ